MSRFDGTLGEGPEFTSGKREDRIQKGNIPHSSQRPQRRQVLRLRLEDKVAFGLYRDALSVIYLLSFTRVIQTCDLSEEEFNDFLALYTIPLAYHVILPKSNQIVFDAPPGYVRLYTHSFSLANLRLPLTEFFCEALEYFHIHISRLNLFGCAKLTTFVVMCKAYGCEPTVELFRGFFNLRRGGKWLTFAKRPEKHIPHLFSKVITRIEGWKGRFFYIPPNIEKNPMFQRLGRYLTSIHVFHDPILFLAGLQSSWEHGQQRPAILVGGKEMAFRNFVYAKDEEDLSFLPKEPSLASPAEVTVDSGGSPKHELFVVHAESVAARIKDRKCKTRGGSSRPPVKRKLASGSSNSRATHAKTSTSKDDVPFITVSDDDEAVIDNAVNRSSHELLEIASLEAEKARLEAVEVSLRKEVNDVKLDRIEVILKVVLYATMELIHIDDLGSLVGMLVSSAIFYGRCKAFKQVARMKEPFDLSKVKGYHPSYKKE
ncbi:hypothetical protein Tco_0138421 [Tanacetum coccineum]